MATIWDVLGIEPTTDEREIRRAYARELKQRRPADDPQGFQELREAFDSAKRYASSFATLPEEETLEREEPEPTPMAAYVQRLTLEQPALAETSWSRDELWHRAQWLATLLISDELSGLGELHQYLDNEIPDALAARQAFSLMLAESLSEQPGLNRSLLNEVSAVMDWQIDRYHSYQLPDETIFALEEQITHSEQENYWQALAVRYAGSRLAQLKWRLLAEKGTEVPWWARLIPDLLQQLVKQASEIRQHYPTLQERLNPRLLNELDKPGLAISWGAVIAVLFWGYTAWLPGQASPKMALQSGLMLAVVATFIWGYPALERRFEAGGAAHKYVHAFFWLASVSIIAMAFYSILRGGSAWPGKDALATRMLVIVPFLVVPVVWALWQRRGEWRTLPITIVVVFLMFPILFIRQLPPLVNLLGLMLLPMLYGILIEMTFFVK